MIVSPKALSGVVELTPRVYEDHRGGFKEIIHPHAMAAAGIPHRFVQCNASTSKQGVLRGLHFQGHPYAQSKLIWVTRGRIFDVAVDVRPKSPTFGQHVHVILSADDHNMLYIPIGFAHGFYAVTDCDVIYACGDHYEPTAEKSIRWDDPDLAIPWPHISPPILSVKDAEAPYLADVANGLVWPSEAYFPPQQKNT